MSQGRTDLTVIYYTNNLEKPEFEGRIQKTLKESTDSLGVPIISVSQKPIDFGKNICVGEVGASSQNAFRQLQIGAMEAKTRFVCPAEADFLHPREYFEFVPPSDRTAWVAIPVWVLYAQRGIGKVYYEKPRGSEAAMVINRDLLIRSIHSQLKDFGMWGDNHSNGKSFQYLFKITGHKYFFLDKPIVTFKTDRNMHLLS